MARNLAQARAAIESLFAERQDRLAQERANYRAQVPFYYRPLVYLASKEVINPNRWYWQPFPLKQGISARNSWKHKKLEFEQRANEEVNRLLKEILTDRSRHAEDANTAPYYDIKKAAEAAAAPPGSRHAEDANTAPYPPTPPYSSGGRTADQANLHVLQTREVKGTHPTRSGLASPYDPALAPGIPGSVRGLDQRRTDAIRLLRSRHLFRYAGWHGFAFEGEQGPSWFQPVLSGFIAGITGGIMLLTGGLGLFSLPFYIGHITALAITAFSAHLPFLIPQRGLVRKHVFHLDVDLGDGRRLRAGSQQAAIRMLKELTDEFEKTEITGRYTGIIVVRQALEELRANVIPKVLRVLEADFIFHEGSLRWLLNGDEQRAEVQRLFQRLYTTQERTRRDVPTLNSVPPMPPAAPLIELHAFLADRIANNTRLHSEEMKEIVKALNEVYTLMHAEDERKLQNVLTYLRDFDDISLAGARASALKTPFAEQVFDGRGERKADFTPGKKFEAFIKGKKTEIEIREAHNNEFTDAEGNRYYVCEDADGVRVYALGTLYASPEQIDQLVFETSTFPFLRKPLEVIRDRRRLLNLFAEEVAQATAIVQASLPRA